MDEEKKSKTLISSSMIDLKAELYRKQEEFKRQKESSAVYIKAKKSEKAKKGGIWSKQNPGVLSRAKRDIDNEEQNVEEEELLAKSRRILEQKSKVYNSYTDGSSIPEEDGSEYYLVDFQKKAIDAIVEERETKRRKEDDEEAAEALAQEIPEASCPEEEWVDFVDSLGRDRRCMKKDLDQLMERDRKLAIAQTSKGKANYPNFLPAEASGSGGSPNNQKSAEPQLMSTDMHREMMRQKWEAEAQELLDKGQDEIHYSNVRYDEIRSHGVGFYQFSKDHTKREEEMENLQRLREETKDERSRKDKIKDKRKAMLEARLAKVRQRRKLKEEPAPVVPDTPESTPEEDEEGVGPKLSEALIKVEDKSESTVEQSKAAETPVREWDRGKKIENPWSTKNYVTARRQERENEFAPPAIYFDQKINTTQSKSKNKSTSDSERMDRLQKTVSKSSTSSESLELSPNSIPLPHSPPQSGSSANQTREEITAFAHPSISAYAPGQFQSDQGASNYIVNPQRPDVSSQWSVSQSYQQHQPVLNPVERDSGAQASNNIPSTGTAEVNCFSYQQWPVSDPCSYQYPSHVYPHVQTNSGTPQGWGNISSQQGATSSLYYNHSSSQSNTNNAAQPNTSCDNITVASAPPAHSQSQNNFNNGRHKHKDNRKRKATRFDSEDNARDKSDTASKSMSSLPKIAIVDTRYVNNFDPSSINPEPGKVPDVGGVPYQPGSFSKYRPHGRPTGTSSDSVKQVQEDLHQQQEGAQISGGPLKYTQEQLDRQQRALEDEQQDLEEKEELGKDSEADRKLQEFLSSIRNETS